MHCEIMSNGRQSELFFPPTERLRDSNLIFAVKVESTFQLLIFCQKSTQKLLSQSANHHSPPKKQAPVCPPSLSLSLPN